MHRLSLAFSWDVIQSSGVKGNREYFFCLSFAHLPLLPPAAAPSALFPEFLIACGGVMQCCHIGRCCAGLRILTCLKDVQEAFQDRVW